MNTVRFVCECGTPKLASRTTGLPYCPLCQPKSNHVMNIDGTHALSVCWCQKDIDYAQSERGKLGGQSKSPAKAKASRKNGKKGGRPRKGEQADGQG